MIGEIVNAKAGRDKGNYFVVISVDGEYVKICDGRRRKLENPKKKKLKHLRLKVGVSDFIRNKLLKNDKITNTQIRNELLEYYDSVNKPETEIK